MTKLLSVRVVVPCDDLVLLDQLKQALREHLESLPVQRVGDDGAAGRIHWSAVDVLRGVERSPGAAVSRKAKKVTTAQGELVS